MLSSEGCIGTVCVILEGFSLSSPFGRLVYYLIKVSRISICTRLYKPPCNLYIHGAISPSGPFLTNEKHVLNGSVGNNQADHYSDCSETRLVRRQKGCLALLPMLPHAVQSCKAKMDMPDTKRPSRQVSFINHDQIQTEAVAALYRLLTGLRV